GVGAEHAMLFRSRNHLAGNLEALGPLADAGCKLLEGGPAVSAVEAADHGEIAINGLVRDEPLDPFQGVVSLAGHGVAALAAVAPAQLVVVGLDAGADLAAVAGAATEA